MDTNIQVGIRVRPLIKRELEAHRPIVWGTKENCIYTVSNSLNKPHAPASYEFDKVFGKNVGTKEIYDVLGSPIVGKVMEGFNGTLFAYGQTASGKTHTIMGDTNEPGIIPLAIEDVFQHIEQSPNREFLMRASYVEIYNEEITDLLTNKKNIKVRNNMDNEVVIDNIYEESIISYDQVMTVIDLGKKNRVVGKTNMNERSSRSHVIFRLIVESRALPDELNVSEFDGAVIVSELNLVDLAGSERANQTGAQGQRLKESGFINTSLMTLGTVIKKLCDPDGHIPYRDSKLTRILQNSLGGNAKTSIICTVSPVVYEETNQTLKFAGRAKNVKNNPKINEILDGDTQMRRQMNEIKDLKKKIKELEGGAMHAEIMQEQDKMLAEKQMYHKKIEEQEDKIQKLLQQMVCAGRVKSQSHKMKANRRQTWCPGGLSSLRAIAENEESDENVFPLRKFGKNRLSFTPTGGPPAKKLSITKEEVNESFEQNEYDFMKEEYEELKKKSKKDSIELQKALHEKEMESEILKNQLRDMKAECDRLKDSNNDATNGTVEQLNVEKEALQQEIEQLNARFSEKLNAEQEKLAQAQTEAEEWQQAMDNTLQIKIQENQELMNEINLLRSRGNEGENEEIAKNLHEMEREYDELKSQQENMVPKEYLEDLKKRLLMYDTEKQDHIDQIDDLKTKLKEFTQTSLSSSEQVSALKSESEIFKQQLSALQEELSYKQSEIQTIQLEKKELEEEKDQLKAAQIERAVSSESKNLAESVLSEVQLTELKMENERLSEENGVLDDRRQTVEKELQALREELSSFDIKYQELTKLNESVSMEKDRLTELLKEQEDGHIQVRSQVEALKNEMDIKQEEFALELKQSQEINEEVPSKDEVEKLKAEIARLNSDLGTLNDVIESQGEENKCIQDQHDKLIEQNENLIEQLSLMDTEKQGLEEQLATADTEKQNIQEQLSTSDSTEKHRLQLSSMDTEKQSLQEQLSTADTEKQNLQEQLSTADTEKQSLQEQLSAADNEKKNLLEQLSSMDAEMQSLQEQLFTVDTEKQSLQKQLSSRGAGKKIPSDETSDSDKTQHKEDNKELLEKIGQLQNELETLAVEKKDLLAAFNSMKESYIMREFELTSSIESTQTELAKLIHSSGVKEQELKAEKEKLESLRVQLEQTKTEATDNTTTETIAKLEHALSEITTEKKSMEEEIAKLLQEREELSQKTNDKEKETETAEEVLQIRQQMDEQMTLLASKEEYIHRMEKEHEDFQNVYNTEKEKVCQLEDKIFLLQNEKEEIETRIEEVQSSKHALQIEVKELKEEMNELQIEIQNKSNVSALNTANHEFELLTVEVEHLRSENENLKSKTSELPEQITTLNQQEVKSTDNEQHETLVELQQLLLEKDEKIIKLEGEHDTFQNVFNVEKEKLQNLEETIHQLQSDGETLEKEKEELHLHKLRSDEMVEELKQELRKQAEDGEIQELLSSKQQEIEKLTKELEDRMEIVKELQTLNQDLNSKEDSQNADQLAEQIVAQNQQIQTLTNDLVEQREAVQKLQEINQILNEQKERLEGDMFCLEEDKSRLAEEVESLKVEIGKEAESLKEEVDEWKDKYDMESKEVESLKHLLAELTDSKESVDSLTKKELLETKAILEEKTNTIESLSAALEEAHKISEIKTFDIENLQTAKQSIQKELEKFVEEYQLVSNQKNGLLEDLGELRTSLVAMEKEIKALKISKANAEEFISKGKERMQFLTDEKKELEEMVKSLEEAKEEIAKELTSREGIIDQHSIDKENWLIIKVDLDRQNIKLAEHKSKLEEEATRVKVEKAKLEEEIKRLEEALVKERNSCEEERSLCKTAYQRESKQKDAQASELVKCMKALQAENAQLSEIKMKLENQLDDLKSSSDHEENDNKLADEKIMQFQSKLENLKQVYEEEVNSLNKEKQDIEFKLSEGENLYSALKTDYDGVLEEFDELKIKYEKEVTLNNNKNISEKEAVEQTEGQLDEKSTERVKKLEKQLKLRSEDIEVYKSRIKEQDKEINVLRNKKEELKQQMIKATAHFESIRRPSGTASTEKWELLCTELEMRIQRIENEKGQLKQRNDMLTKKLKEYSESLKNASIKLKQQESSLKKQQQNDSSKLQESFKDELENKNEEVIKLHTAIQKAYGRMQKAEQKVKEINFEFNSKLELKDDEIKRISDGLNKAFERYKYYKGCCQEKENEMKKLKLDLTESSEDRVFLKNKLEQVEVRIRQSLRSEGDVYPDILSLNDEILGTSSNKEIASPSTPPTNLKLSAFRPTNQNISTGTASVFRPINKSNTTITPPTKPDSSHLSSFTDVEIPFSDIIKNIDDGQAKSLFSPTELSSEVSEPKSSFTLKTGSLFSKQSAFVTVDSTKENTKVLSPSYEKTQPSEAAGTHERKKRKSDDPIESQARRRKMVQASPKAAGENECQQQ